MWPPSRCRRLSGVPSCFLNELHAGGEAQLSVDVVRLVSEGLGDKDIATRLFVSPRTVQAHLTHVYTKLGLTFRVQLVQEAARHA